MKWKLQMLDGDGGWEDLNEGPSGDWCKDKARRYQRGRALSQRYRILQPDGKVWMYGASRETAHTFRMKWSYPA